MEVHFFWSKLHSLRQAATRYKALDRFALAQNEDGSFSPRASCFGCWCRPWFQNIPTTLNGICTLLLGDLLGNISPTLDGTEDSTMTCSCTPAHCPAVSYELECGSTDPVCLAVDLLCGIPSASVSVELAALRAGELPVSFDVCFSEIDILNDIPVIEVLGPFCLSLVICTRRSYWRVHCFRGWHGMEKLSCLQRWKGNDL
jgi:hypothetical protein